MTVEHLKRLDKIAKQDREEMLTRNPHLSVYRDRILLVALCQGAALHYVNGKNGVKDIDVYTFYAAVPGVMLTPRRHGVTDFGESEFGYWSKEKPIRGQRLVGRRVDLLQRSLKVPPDADPVQAVRAWLQTKAWNAIGVILVCDEVMSTGWDLRTFSSQQSDRRVHALQRCSSENRTVCG